MELIKHPEFGEIRTVIKKREPWFVAQDLCDILDIQWKGSGTLGYLDEDEKGSAKCSTPGGPQEMMVINESGLYTLIMRSNKPAAKKFRKWVTGEVLPSIRRDGFYVHPDYLTRKETNQLNRSLAQKLERYLTEDDLRKVAKKFGLGGAWSVTRIIGGGATDNAVMQECQRRALLNKEN